MGVRTSRSGSLNEWSGQRVTAETGSSCCSSCFRLLGRRVLVERQLHHTQFRWLVPGRGHRRRRATGDKRSLSDTFAPVRRSVGGFQHFDDQPASTSTRGAVAPLVLMCRAGCRSSATRADPQPSTYLDSGPVANTRELMARSTRGSVRLRTAR